MSSNPFDWLTSINDTKVDMMEDDPTTEKGYLPFMVNRGLSYFPDTIMYANEMNRFSFLDKKLQYDFLLSSVSKRKRYSKWSKKDDSEDLKLVQAYYKVSKLKALEIMKLLTESQIASIKAIGARGGY